MCVFCVCSGQTGRGSAVRVVLLLQLTARGTKCSSVRRFFFIIVNVFESRHVLVLPVLLTLAVFLSDAPSYLLTDAPLGPLSSRSRVTVEPELDTSLHEHITTPTTPNYDEKSEYSLWCFSF